ncbi:MAG: SO_0444 family Cu/Zn efflux transporter [Phycisphaerales bacterium]|nr:SO_0444 family Cu/Zn efflux transporter [Phycisphaerales bacterium]
MTRYLDALWMLLLDTGFWLVAGLLFAGVIHVLIPRHLLARHLSGRGIGPVLKASLLGIPLPLCSCSVIPVAAGLRQSGASKGAAAAFAISTPQTGEESIPLTWALFGPVYAFVRPIAAVITAFIAGTLIDRLCEDETSGEDETGATDARAGAKASSSSCCSQEAAAQPAAPTSCCSSAPKTSSCCSTTKETPPTCCDEAGAATSRGTAPESGSSCHEEASSSCCAHERADESARSSRVREVMQYAFVTLLRDLSPWLAIGLLLSALIATVVPAGWIESNIGTGLLPMAAMLLVGLPLYVCATSTTPLAYTLVVAGLSPGAALVLLLAGPATNIATMAWVVKDLGGRALSIYLVTIAIVAVAIGLLFDAMLSSTIHLASEAHDHQHEVVSLGQTVGAIVFSVLLLWALVARYVRPRLT